MKISVITAAYRSAATVGQAIDSVARQTHRDVEHIVVEGASPDDTLAAIETARHARMRVVSEPDSGIYDALNKGVGLASGEVVGFLHSDDFLAHPDALARIAEAFADPAVEAVFSDLDYVSQADVSRVIRRWATGPYDPRKLRRGWMPAHPTLYLRREVYDRLGGFDTQFRIAADYDFILRYFSQVTAKTIYIPETLYKMRVGGISNRSFATIRRKWSEDLRALRRNRTGGFLTLAAKNLSKLPQFLRRSRRTHAS